MSQLVSYYDEILGLNAVSVRTRATGEPSSFATAQAS